MQTLKITRTYIEAESVCEGIGGHVLALETEQESDDVWEMFRAPRGKCLASSSNDKKMFIEESKVKKNFRVIYNSRRW